MPDDKKDDKRTQYPFFWGIYYGAVSKPPQLFVGGLRTLGQLGLQGAPQQQVIQYHNLLTARAAKAGLRYAAGANVDPALISTLWNALPPEAQSNTIDWGKQQAGQLLGGSAVSWVIGKGLVRYLPKQIITPALFFLTCQGAMGLFWKDAWDKGPPPPPPGVGGGGKEISV
ncbi:hypothetical protein [Corallococcus aberystwythensis]|uniref:Uncharacterized protein n=1 Tax=Corallococcus aberystwythensis TaxID=2316722 RepID=A0A3A8PXE2_9BACT|nr:hypothetical protein [Corallococcus aberystwythensis]RKH56064.1 hypothetical protein D7W81_34860 [Corallococcus aberystwythensis]